MTSKENRFWVALKPEGDPFNNGDGRWGYGVVDEIKGGAIAYFADENDALHFVAMRAKEFDYERWNEGMYVTNPAIIETVAEALFKVFRWHLPKDDHEAKTLLRKHIFGGKQDPGQWSPNALAIVHIEALMIPGNEEVKWIEQWAEAAELLGKAYFEHINGAVVAVYPC